MSKIRWLNTTCAFLLGASCLTPSQAAVYTITDLGTLGGTNSTSRGLGINDNGLVTGISENADGINRAFLYNGTTMIDLGALSPTPGTSSAGNDINQSGHVVGTSPAFGLTSGFLYNGSTLQDIGALGGLPTTAFGINDNGLVTGASQDANNKKHAFIYDGTTMQDLGTVTGFSSATSEGRAINASGWVTGDSSSTSAGNNAFLYDGTTMHDLGTLLPAGTLFARSKGFDINASGQVTGNSTDRLSGSIATGSHAFLYDGVSMQDLGTLGGEQSVGLGINDSGYVAGWAQDINFNQLAFLYDGNNMLDLCVLVDCVGAGWTNMSIASAINNNGDITGQGFINGDTHAFLIQVQAVPIPATAWLFGSGLIGLIGIAKRKKA